MKTNAILTVLTLIGSAVGLGIAIAWRETGWEFVFEVFCGSLVGFLVAFALTERHPGMLIGIVFGLVLAILIDWVAGSTLDPRNKLSYAAMGAGAGWDFKFVWKPALMGGVLLGALGVTWGLLQSHPFGTVRLPPGYLNSALFGAQFTLIGMGIGVWFVHCIGWNFYMKHRWLH